MTPKAPRPGNTYRAYRRNFWRRITTGWSWTRLLSQLVGSGWPRKNKPPAWRRGVFANRRAERTAPHVQRRMLARRAA